MKWKQSETHAEALGLSDQWEVHAQVGAVPTIFGWNVVGVVSVGPGTGTISVKALGLEETLEQAMGAATSAYERLRYAFCTESAEDFPHALSSLLEKAETLVAAKDRGDFVWAARDNFKSSCDFARRVLAKVPPRQGPP